MGKYDDYQFYTYVLSCRTDGVFYVGTGRETRLNNTINEVRQKHTLAGKGKVQKIRAIWARGEEVELDIVFASNDQRLAQQWEHFLIMAYGPCLVNSVGVNSQAPWYISGKPPRRNPERVRDYQAALAKLREVERLAIVVASLDAYTPEHDLAIVRWIIAKEEVLTLAKETRFSEQELAELQAATTAVSAAHLKPWEQALLLVESAKRLANPQ